MDSSRCLYVCNMYCLKHVMQVAVVVCRCTDESDPGGHGLMMVCSTSDGCLVRLTYCNYLWFLSHVARHYGTGCAAVGSGTETPPPPHLSQAHTRQPYVQFIDQSSTPPIAARVIGQGVS